MISDTIAISNEELSLLLMKDYQSIIDSLYSYDKLDERQKKICLLSCLFLLKLYSSYANIESEISDDHKNKIINILNEQQLQENEVLIGFYISQYGPRTCVEHKSRRSEMRVPTKSDYLFKPIDSLDYNNLKHVLLNATDLKNENSVSIILSKNQEIFLLLKDVLNDVKIVRKKQYNIFS